MLNDLSTFYITHKYYEKKFIAAKIRRKSAECFIFALNQVKNKKKKYEQAKNAVYLQRA